jgi:uncharacterized coiled-coil protein SlyX
MRNNRRGFVIALMILASLILFVGSLVISEHSMAQNPTPKAATPDSTAQKPEGTDLDCEKIEQDIKGLSDALAELAADLARLNDKLDDVDKRTQKLEADEKTWQEKYKNSLNPAKYGLDYEYIRGTFLDARAKLANLRRDLKKAIEDEQDAIQAIKDVIADLLNKLGNCGAKTSTSTPSPVPTPSPTPTSNPPENKRVALLPGYHVDAKTANGLFVTTFDTPQGKIKVNITDDVAAGDTISGTVETEPVGKNDAERAQDQTELNGFVIELEGQKFTVGDKKFTCNIPAVLTPEARTIVLQLNGQTVAIKEIPILVTRPPTPNTFTLPTGGQQGKPIQLKGPCDGVFAPNDSIKVGLTILPPVAESPRSLVVLNTSDVIGPTNIDCHENGVAMQCPFRNIGIKLSAEKLNLQRGETTTLHVVVTGLAGMTQDVLYDLIVTTPNVIKMSGGNVQGGVIQAPQVHPDGTYSTDRTLTGIQAGGFGVTGTIRWSEVCKHPPTQ